METITIAIVAAVIITFAALVIFARRSVSPPTDKDGSTDKGAG